MTLSGDHPADDPPFGVDPDDTAGCPRGTAASPAAPSTPSWPGHCHVPRSASLCLTLCPVCAAFDSPPPIALSTAVRLVAQHLEHLGVTR